jgi:uncharacterized protein involved in exopolysaccharide biosynthesis
MTPILEALRRNPWLVAATTLLVPFAAAVVTLVGNDDYSASTLIVLRDPGLDEEVLRAPQRGSPDPAREAATNVQVASVRPIAVRTAKRLGTGVTPAHVSGHVRVTGLGRSDIASVNARQSTRERAIRLANIFASEVVAYRRRLARAKLVSAERFIAERLRTLSPADRNGSRGDRLRRELDRVGIVGALQTGDADVIQPATSADRASSSQLAQTIPLALVIGFALGTALAVLRYRDPAAATT